MRKVKIHTQFCAQSLQNIIKISKAGALGKFFFRKIFHQWFCFSHFTSMLDKVVAKHSVEPAGFEVGLSPSKNFFYLLQ